MITLAQTILFLMFGALLIGLSFFLLMEYLRRRWPSDYDFDDSEIINENLAEYFINGKPYTQASDKELEKALKDAIKAENYKLASIIKEEMDVRNSMEDED